LSGGAAGAAEGKLLRWKFAPGQTLHYLMTQDMTSNVRAGEGAAMKLTTNMNMDMILKVEAVDPKGVASLSQTIDRIQMKLQSPQGVMLDYDSASGKEPEGMARMLEPFFSGVLKKPFKMKMTPRGEVIEMKPPQGFLEGVNKMVGGDAMGGLFSEESMTKMSAFGSCPEEPVTPGKTWSRKVTTKVPVLGPMTVETLFRYVGTEDRGGRTLEKIAATMQMKTQDKQEKQEKPAAGMKGIESDGFLYFDNEAGRMAETQAKIKMNISVTVGTMNVEQDVEMDQRMELKHAEAAARK
jgi:hypothetical protein